MMLNIKLYISVILLFKLTTSIAQTRKDVSFIFEGRKRESIIVIPSTPAPIGGYPLVIMLHGTSGDGEKFFQISAWKELGVEKNFVTVFPSSLSWCWTEDGNEVRNTRWVNGSVTEFPCAQNQNYVDDVKFLKFLVKIISDTIPINSCKVFASGFSNGSAMISKLAVDAGDVFTAVAGSGSFLHTGDSASSIKRIPIWLTMGTEDPLFASTNFPTLPYGDDSITIYFKKAFTRIRAVQGLQDIFEKKETSITKTYTYNQCITGEKCMPFIFTIIKGMGHEYPNGINFPLIAANNFWEFFENACQTTSTSNTSKNKEILKIFPNPSCDIVTIQISEPVPIEVLIYSMNGKLALKKYCRDFPIHIKKSEVGDGMFLIAIRYNNNVQYDKIMFY